MWLCPINPERYSLVNTKCQQVEIFRRTEGDLWVLQTYTPNEPVELQSIGLAIALVANENRLIILPTVSGIAQQLL